jgi:RHS repeat-associated protein
VVEKNNGALIDERITLGGFEIFRRRNATGIALERETLHVMDDRERVALVDTRARGEEAGVPAQLIRYQFGNHLGSATLEVDDGGQIISYEEYYPYGSTSYQAGRAAAELSLKRYRYTGMERDEETGLSYHGARYYAPWLGRWTSADPAGIRDGTNIFAYSSGNPVRFTDRTGFDSKEQEGIAAYYNYTRQAQLEARNNAVRDELRQMTPKQIEANWQTRKRDLSALVSAKGHGLSADQFHAVWVLQWADRVRDAEAKLMQAVREERDPGPAESELGAVQSMMSNAVDAMNLARSIEDNGKDFSMQEFDAAVSRLGGIRAQFTEIISIVSGVKAARSQPSGASQGRIGGVGAGDAKRSRIGPMLAKVWGSITKGGGRYDCVASTCARSIRSPSRDDAGRKVPVKTDEALEIAKLNQQTVNSTKGINMSQARELFKANGKILGEEPVTSTAATGDYAVLLYQNGMPTHMAYGRRTATGKFYIDDVQLNQRFTGEQIDSYLGRYQRAEIYKITDGGG